MVALKHIHGSGIVHADIKLDNIVVNEARTRIKVCDFGTAMEMGRGESGEGNAYVASRFYRAPETILGVPSPATAAAAAATATGGGGDPSAGGGIDIWAAGCTLAELATGRILFAGHTNNEMIRLMMELRGRIPKRVLARARLRAEHFDEQMNFLRRDVDAVSRREVVRAMGMPNVATRDLWRVLVPDPADEPKDATEHRRLSQFRDILEKCLSLDPGKRLTATAALSHPFFSS